MSCRLRFTEAANLAVHACAMIQAGGSGSRLNHREIAGALGVSESHLSKVMQKLVHRGILASERGTAGGFTLAADPSRLTLLEIIECIEGRDEKPACLLGRPICARGGCILSDLSLKVSSLVEDRLGGTTLEEFTSRQSSKRKRKE